MKGLINIHRTFQTHFSNFEAIEKALGVEMMAKMAKKILSFVSEMNSLCLNSVSQKTHPDLRDGLKTFHLFG